VGLLGAAQRNAAIGAVSTLVQTPLGKRVDLAASAGLFGSTSGSWSPRDVQVRVPLRLVDRPTALWTLGPGVSLPTGSIASGIEYTALTTSSVDPTLTSSLTFGGAWVGALDGTVRWPVHAGFDRIRQGVYGRFDARLARRVGGGAVIAGLSYAAQQTRGLTSPGFQELAVVAGASLPLSDTWGSQVGLRVPVLTDEVRYLAALQVGVTRVVGKPRGH
jgi:hypothetical protein